MLKNYINETYIKGKVPELANYLWTGETDYSKQKLSAEQIVMADLSDYQVRLLRPELYLETSLPSGQVADIGNRNRCVIICTAVTGTATIEVFGANETTDTFVSAGVSDSLAEGANTFLLTDFYKYYKYTLTGTATLDSVYLVESANYDLIYAYKWLYLILKDAMVEKDDVYDTRAKDFDAMYNARLQSFKPFYDRDEDGDIVDGEQVSNNIVTIQH